jgi:lipoyl synthase
MVGCGEHEDETLDAMQRLRDAGVDVLTIGQYLRPTEKHAELVRYVHPEEFARYAAAGETMGFKHVSSGPLVRSSYRAAEVFLKGVLRGEQAPFSDRYGKQPRKLTVIP